MRKLGCVGAVAAALLLCAGTARADPFTVTSNTQSARGVGALWFNDLIKLNNSSTARTKTYLSDSIIIFGGDVVGVPSSSVTVMSSGGGGSSFADSGWSILVQSGLGAIFITPNAHAAAAASAAASPSAADPPPGNSHGNGNGNPSPPGLLIQVPGASAAYDVLSPGFSGLGLSMLSTNDHDADDVTTSTTGPTGSTTGGGTAGDPPATPEPSPILLLAAGLLFALVMKRFDFRFSRG